MEEIISELTKRNLTIATMESCTGGALVNAITNINGASAVLKFSAITYSNEFKIKMGVSRKVIKEYSVYSINTAREMALNISLYAGSDIGIGITGKLNKPDENNHYGKDNEVFVSIYYKQKYYDLIILVRPKNREENKNLIIRKIIQKLRDILEIK